MKIGIIGAGNIGATLARKFVAAGHAVKLAGSKGADDVRDKAEQIGATPAAAHDAVKDVDVVVLSIPFAKIPDVASVFVAVPDTVIVIDTSNYYPMRDGVIPAVEDGQPESVWSSEQIGHPVIKAFNAVLAHTLAANGQPAGTAGRIALPVAGDDAHGKDVARQLVDAAGFDSVDAGALADSWRQQPGTPAYCTELAADDLRAALSQAYRARAPKNRDAIMQALMNATTPPSHEQMVAHNREATGAR